MADRATLAEAQLRTIKDLTGMSVDNFAQQASSPPAVIADGPVQLAVGRLYAMECRWRALDLSVSKGSEVDRLV